VLGCLPKFKIFNFHGLGIRCNSLLILKNIIFSRGPNGAPQRFHIRSHDQPLHRVNSSVSSYFWFTYFNVDFDLLLFCHLQGSKAFLLHGVKLSSLINRKHISTFSLQHPIHLLLHTLC
jgi:hypothetical protein